MLEIRDLQAGYEYLQVIWNVSFNVSQGEFVSLVGPNGAGKTTLLRSIAGVVKPKAGDVVFMNNPLRGLSTAQICRLGISYITEDLNLFTGMTVLENLLLGGYTVREGRKTRSSLDYVFSLFPVLAARQKQLAGTLSGGERKMLAIGRGLMPNPKLLLVDEPSLGLAPKLAAAVFEALRELNRRGNTVLLVEQNVRASLRITQRGYVLEQGRIVLQGKSEDLAADQHVRQVYLGVKKALA